MYLFIKTDPILFPKGKEAGPLEVFGEAGGSYPVGTFQR